MVVSVQAASWAPWMILPAWGEVAISSEMRPIVWDRRKVSARAMAFGRHPSSATAAQTRSRVSCGMWVFGTSLTTKETVVCETPARRATSYMEGGLRFDDLGGAGTATTCALTTVVPRN